MKTVAQVEAELDAAIDLALDAVRPLIPHGGKAVVVLFDEAEGATGSAIKCTCDRAVAVANLLSLINQGIGTSLLLQAVAHLACEHWVGPRARG